jgi:hypothetical protein
MVNSGTISLLATFHDDQCLSLFVHLPYWTPSELSTTPNDCDDDEGPTRLSPLTRRTRPSCPRVSLPFTFLTFQLSPKQASFALSRHLDLESFETLDEDSLIWDGPLHQEFVGQGPKDGLLLSIDESHVYGTFSRLLNIFMRPPADLTCLGTVSNRRHSEEAESNFRDPFHLFSRLLSTR